MSTHKEPIFKETEIGPIPEEWEVVDLEKLIDFSNGKSSPERIINGKYPVYGSNGIIGFSDEKNLAQDSIIIGRVGSYCGSVYFSNSASWVTDNAIKGCAKEGADSNYLYYLLQTLNLNKRAGGSGQPLINQSILNAILVQAPPLDEQKRIAEILSSLDDKIELNRKMNKTLEEIAQALFKRWFVDFEFPDENGKPYKSSGGKMIDSDLGPIPEGWRVSDIRDVVNIVYGKGLPTDKLSQVGYPVFGGNGVIGFYGEYIYEEPQVVIGCRGAGSGNIRQTYPKSFVTNNSLVLESTSNSTIDRFYLKHFLHTIDISGFVTGSAQPQITIANLCRLNFLIPEKKLLDIFKDNLLGIDCIQTENELEIQRLSVIRDSLLPRLMSGKIRTNS